MIESIKMVKNRNRILGAILGKYILTIIACFIVTLLAVPYLWAGHVYVVHTILELICIFIAFSTFLIIWNMKLQSFASQHLIGCGFISIAIFDSFHTYFLVASNLFGLGYMGLPAKYWIIGRFAEALMLFMVSRKSGKILISKWVDLFIFIFLSFAIAILTLLFPSFMPEMIANNRPTAMKYIMEYLITAITLASLYNLKDEIESESAVSYKNIFMALLFIIPAELSFTINKQLVAFHNPFGHVMKIVCYYYLYKSVFVSCVEYPYRKLEEAYDKLESTNKSIEEMSAALNDTLDALPVGIVKYEADRRVKYVNRRLEEILKCDRRTVIGITAKQLKNRFTTGVKHEKDIFQLTYEHGREQKNLVRTYVTEKGESIKLSVTSQRLKKGLLVYFNEVKKEQEINNFNLQTQTILNALNSCVIMIDCNKKIILINRAFSKVFEAEEAELIGMQLDELNKKVEGSFKKQFEFILRGGETDQPCEMSVVSFKGNRRELLTYAAQIKNVDNELIGAISVSTDITEIRKQQHNMQQQDKLAMIGQMAAGIVHEIKNPLATIKGLSQLIASKSQVDKIREYSNVINSAIDDTTKVVNEFLNFAKPKPTLKVRTSLNNIVESMQLLTETQCYTKNIKVQFHYSACPMEVTADEFKIKQVILNITENAIAAMEQVELPELLISTYYSVDTKEGVIKLSDNGIGMPPEVLEKLGTPFFTTKDKGTGLGLGICYQIMAEHYGRIEVESVEGKGTTFRLIFTQIEDLI